MYIFDVENRFVLEEITVLNWTFLLWLQLTSYLFSKNKTSLIVYSNENTSIHLPNRIRQELRPQSIKNK